MTATQRSSARDTAAFNAGITKNNGIYAWSTQHASGNAIDVDRVNDVRIFNGATRDNRTSSINQSTVISQFTDSLSAQQHSALFTPWRVYGSKTNESYQDVNRNWYLENTNQDGVQYDHRNHIHFGR